MPSILMTSSTALCRATLARATLVCLLATPNMLAQAAGFGGQTIISTAADRPTDIFVADLDGDGDLPDIAPTGTAIYEAVYTVTQADIDG